MAEILSRAGAVIAAGGKVLPSVNGKQRCLIITSPATVTWADGDTIGAGFELPAGVRFLSGSFVSCQDMGTSIVVDIGTRDFKTKVAIDADGIAAGVDVATAAARQVANSGVFVANGAEFVTTAPCEVYATVRGGVATANSQFRCEVEYLSND